MQYKLAVSSSCANRRTLDSLQRPLYIASEKGHVGVARTLLDHGAQVHPAGDIWVSKPSINKQVIDSKVTPPSEALNLYIHWLLGGSFSVLAKTSGVVLVHMVHTYNWIGQISS